MELDNFEDDSEFLNAPYLYRNEHELNFNSNRVTNANGNYGSPFALR